MDAAVRRSWIRGGVFGAGAIGAVQVSARLGPVAGTAAGLVAAAAAAYGGRFLASQASPPKRSRT